jgi:hypothetical protein
MVLLIVVHPVHHDGVDLEAQQEEQEDEGSLQNKAVQSSVTISARKSAQSCK